MAETRGDNPEITPEEVKEEATAEVVEKAPFLARWDQVRHIVWFYTLYVMAAVLLVVLELRVL
jgi:hypothetical protein